MRNTLILMFVILFSITMFATDADRPIINGQFVYNSVDLQNMTYSVTVQLNTDIPFTMEQVKARFTFNTIGLSFYSVNVLDTNLINGYEISTYLSQDGQKIWVEMDLLDESVSGYEVGTNFANFIEFNFEILDQTQWSNICLFASHTFRAIGVDGDLTVGDWPCDEYPLPVELTSFTANVSDNKVVLNWSTETETNNAGFEIERDGEIVGFVEGNGTTTYTSHYTYTDNPGVGTFSYRLKQIDYNGTFEYFNTIEVSIVADEFVLNQNYPNPFNPSTTITYELRESGNVSLVVYDLLGKEVATLVNEAQTPGIYDVVFTADNYSTALYIYRLQVNDNVSVKKMTLLK